MCVVLKNDEPAHVEREKCISVLRVLAQSNQDFVTKKDCRTVKMIIGGHPTVQIIHRYKKRGKRKVALGVELSILR